MCQDVIQGKNKQNEGSWPSIDAHLSKFAGIVDCQAFRHKPYAHLQMQRRSTSCRENFNQHVQLHKSDAATMQFIKTEKMKSTSRSKPQLETQLLVTPQMSVPLHQFMYSMPADHEIKLTYFHQLWKTVLHGHTEQVYSLSAWSKRAKTKFRFVTNNEMPYWNFLKSQHIPVSPEPGLIVVWWAAKAPHM